MYKEKSEKLSEVLEFSIFNYDKEMFARYVKKCINYCIEQDELTINIPKLVKHLGFKVYFKEMENKATIKYDGLKNYASLYINQELSLEDKNAIAVLIIAEFLVRFQQYKKKEIHFDMFYIDNIKQSKMSKQVFLATRLALPEKVINKLDNFDSDKEKYSQKAKLPVYFLDLAKKRKSVELFLQMSDCEFSSWLGDL